MRIQQILIKDSYRGSGIRKERGRNGWNSALSLCKPLVIGLTSGLVLTLPLLALAMQMLIKSQSLFNSGELLLFDNSIGQLLVLLLVFREIFLKLLHILLLFT
jgi:hypothetical protein